MRGWRCVLVASVLAAACGGGGGQAADPPASSTAPAAEAPASDPEAERKLRAAQDAAVAALCERLVECAFDEARARMTPEEVAELEAEDTGRQLRAKCEGEGASSALSPRQIRVVQRCVSHDGTCDELHACVAEAKKQAN